MTDHDDALYLAHIDEAATRIEQSASRRGREALGADAELRDATLYRLQTLAESTQRLSFGLKASYPDIPWEDIGGFRNRVVHGYLGVDLDIIWDVVRRDLPALARMARTELTLRGRRPPDRDLDDGLGLGP